MSGGRQLGHASRFLNKIVAVTYYFNLKKTMEAYTGKADRCN